MSVCVYIYNSYKVIKLLFTYINSWFVHHSRDYQSL